MPKPLPHISSELVPIKRAALILGVSIDTLRRWDKQGKVKSYRPNGRDRLFDPQELEQIKSIKPPKSLDTNLVPISEAAEILEVSIDTIRRWDQKGILHSKRANGDKRYFSVHELEGVKFAKPLTISEASQKLGISHSTLRRLEKKSL